MKDFNYKIHFSKEDRDRNDSNSHVASEMERRFYERKLGITKKTFKKHLDDAARHATNRQWFKKKP